VIDLWFFVDEMRIYLDGEVLVDYFWFWLFSVYVRILCCICMCLRCW